jgi:tetratricopeptide (TPR) repeat protein
MEFLDNFEQYEEKIHGIIHLTGGSPRLAFLFYEMITRGEIKDIEKSLFKIIDEHTPFYQEVFQLLTAQQRRIFDILISFGEPVTPKQISQKARMNLPTVNTQLRRLETNGYVISRPMGRHTKYEVRERLFRLWREMRQPFGRKRVSILLDFLQLWYTPAERKELFKSTFKFFEAGDRSVMKDLCYYAEIQPHEFKAEALLKLMPKLLEMGKNEDARYEINKLKEHAAEYKGAELEDKISLFEWRLLFSENKYEEAVEAIDKFLKINPSNNIALTIKGFALVILRKYEEALEVFNKALEINPDDNFTLSRKGDALVILGKYGEAIEVFNKALEINPNDNFTLSRKGDALVILGKYKEALEVIDKVLEIDSNDVYTLTSKGNVLAILEEDEEAIEVFNKALEISPNDNFTLTCKGVALSNIWKNEEALEVFNKVLEINPCDVFVLAKKGFIFVILGNYEEALEVFNKALEIDPNNELSLKCKVFVLFNLKRYTEELDVAKKIVNIATDEHSKINASLFVIETYMALNRKSEAVLEIENIESKMIDQDPDLIEGFMNICFDLA